MKYGQSDRLTQAEASRRSRRSMRDGQIAGRTLLTIVAAYVLITVVAFVYFVMFGPF